MDRVLGKGTFAKVYLAWLTNDKSKQFACKIINRSKAVGRMGELFQTERRLHEMIESPFITAL